MRSPIWISAVLWASFVEAQSSVNPLGGMISDALSVFTKATSVLAPVYTLLTSDAASIISSASAAQTTNTASTTSSSSTSSSPPSSRSSTARPTSSSSSAFASSSTTAVASASTTSSSDARSGNHHNNLAIILGSVLGVLCLLLLILLLVFCLRRRRKRREASGRHSPADSDINTWRGNEQVAMAERDRRALHTQLMGRRSISDPDPPIVAAAAPKIADHPAYRNSQDNPLVRDPPPIRRTTPNSMPGLTDGTIPGDDAYVTKNHRGIPLMWSRGSTRGSRYMGSVTRKPVPNSTATRYMSDETLLAESPSSALSPVKDNRRDTTPSNIPSRSPRRPRFSQDSLGGGGSQFNLARDSDSSGQIEAFRQGRRRSSSYRNGWHTGVGYGSYETEDRRRSIGQAW